MEGIVLANAEPTRRKIRKKGSAAVTEPPGQKIEKGFPNLNGASREREYVGPILKAGAEMGKQDRRRSRSRSGVISDGCVCIVDKAHVGNLAREDWMRVG